MKKLVIVINPKKKTRRKHSPDTLVRVPFAFLFLLTFHEQVLPVLDADAADDDDVDELDVVSDAGGVWRSRLLKGARGAPGTPSVG